MTRLRPPFRCAEIGVAIAIFAAMPLRGAAAQLAGPAGDEPVQIQADSGIEWQQNAHLYIARGNAVATRGDRTVHADTLIAHYREAKGGSGNTGGNTEIYRVDAEGHVTMERGGQTVVGDRAVYDVDTAIAVVTGKNLKLTTATDVVTARDSLEWYDQKQVAVARGDAVASNGKIIKADILTAYMTKALPGSATAAARGARPVPAPGKPPVTPASTGAAGKGDSESKISRVDAQGHVVIANPVETGRGDFGVYNADSGIATLIGHVVIERGKDVIRGQRGVMDLNTNVSRLLPGAAPGVGHPRVQGLFIRQDQAATKPAQGAASSGKHP